MRSAFIRDTASLSNVKRDGGRHGMSSINLTQAKVIGEEETSIERMPPQDPANFSEWFLGQWTLSPFPDSPIERIVSVGLFSGCSILTSMKRGPPRAVQKTAFLASYLLTSWVIESVMK